MKLHLKIKQTFAILFLVSALAACNPDETDITDAAIEVSDITGDWTCKEKSFLNGSSTFQVKVKSNPNVASEVLIDNFYHSGLDQQVYGTMSNGVINMPKQQFCDDQFSVWGTGTVASNKKVIDWVYYVNTGSDIDSVTAQFVR